MPPRPFMLVEANYRQLQSYRPNVAVLPWGAVEAHNYHLPHGTDCIEAAELAERSAALAYERGGRPIVLPVIPFGNDAQQLDQVATISIGTATAAALLRDVADSLNQQGIDRLVILNAHGGNEFKPLVRDLQQQTKMLIVVINFWQLIPERLRAHFGDPGDHAGRMETAFMLHARPDWVQIEQAGPGEMAPFELDALRQAGVWCPRPWSAVHPDTGSGDPSGATAEQGEAYVAEVVEVVAAVLQEMSSAERGQIPYMAADRGSA